MADEGDRPLSRRLLLDGGRLDLPARLAVENDLYQSCLWNVDIITVQSNTLRNAERVGSPLLALTLGKLRPLLEKVDVGSAEVAKHLLQGLRVTFREEGEVGMLLQEG